jgi:excisionase family DNA binding protein
MTTLDKDLFTAKEVAKYLTVSKAQIFRITQTGKLRSTRISERRIVYTRQAIMDFLASCEGVAA